MSRGKGIMIAATRQHVGKTTTSLALFSGIRKRLGENIGYMKPVGQTHVPVKSEEGLMLKVDKDVRLFKEYFNINSCSYKHMSPVVVPDGYTRKYLDGDIREEEQIEAISSAYAAIKENNIFTVVEGTGHCGVGSIVNLDNARVASILGLDMVLVVNGGLGSAFDELALNRILCLENDVNIRGVVVNKVYPDKIDMISEYFSKALSRWNIPLLGVVPDVQFLGRCTMIDYEMLFKQRVIGGTNESKLWHFNKTELIASGVSGFLKKLKEQNHRKTLFVTHTTREDIVLAFLTQKEIHFKLWGRDWRGGLILAGSSGDLDPTLEATIEQHDFPILKSELPTYETMQKISSYTAKLNPVDVNRTNAASQHYEKHIDFDKIVNNM